MYSPSLAPQFRLMPHPLNLFFLLILLGLLSACAASPNVVTWETASEVNTAGFNVYRGPSVEGPWTQVNTTLIAPASDPVRGGSYEYRDTSAAAGESYYYLLEEIELDGASTRYPPTRLEPSDNRAWLVWIGVAALAVGIGWVVGGRWRANRQTHKDAA